MYLDEIDDYAGGPLVVAPPDGHWIDFWTQECSICGELADMIEAHGMVCHGHKPDYMAELRNIVCR